MESRVHELEKQVGDLREATAANSTEIKSLKEVVADDLVPAVKDLTATINKSKGAIWMAGGVGGLVGWFISTFRGHQ